MSELPNYGEITCEALKADGKRCSNKAYVAIKVKLMDSVTAKRYNKKYVCTCNVHGKKKESIALVKVKTVDTFPEELIVIKAAAKENRNEDYRGSIVMRKMRMMKKVETIPGYLKVFPNFKHGNRKDGLGLSELSPMSLGPVKHKEPGLPKAQNLENFHQQSKAFKSECVLVDDDTDKHTRFGSEFKSEYKAFIADRSVESKSKAKYDPGKKFFKHQKAGFEDETPHRHKIKGEIPMFWVWTDKEGVVHKLGYVESRQFYCNYYERLVKKTKQWKLLKKKVNRGYNIQICGYDALDITAFASKLVCAAGEVSAKKIEKLYLDPDHPFGHELVLYTMLLLEEDEYPWRKYKTYDF